MKLQYIVAYENASDKFDNGHCWIKVTVTLGNFLDLSQNKLLGPRTQLWYKLGSLY